MESVIRDEAAKTGGEVTVGWLGETTFPIRWSDALHRSLGHLVPDIVVRRGRQVRVVDATGWRRFTEEAREAHRADIHQVLAYSALFDADEVVASLVYPLRRETYQALRRQERDVATAELAHGGWMLRLELRGVPFGAAGVDAE